MTTSYKELTLRQQLAIAAIERKGGDELTVQTAILSVLDGRAPDELLKLSLADYAALSAQKRFLDGPFPDGDPTAIQKVGGFHLVPTTDTSKMSVSQFVDFIETSKRGPEALADVLAVFYVPKGCTYGEDDPRKGGYDVNAVRDAILDLPAPDAVAAYAFFLTSFRASLDRSLSSLEKTVNRVKDPEKKREILERIREAKKLRSQLNGDGSTR